MKKYEELDEQLKEEARALNPDDFKEWLYQTIGVEIEFCAR